MDANDRPQQGDQLTPREQLVERIAGQVRRQGYYLSNLDPSPHQTLVDVRWAAMMAGRELRRPLRTYTSAVGRRLPGKVTVIIAPMDVPSVAEVEFCDRLRGAIGQVLSRGAGFAGPMSA